MGADRTTIPGPGHAEGLDSFVSVDGRPARSAWPIRLWSVIGVLVLVIQTIVWIRFAASSPEQLVRYRDPESSAYWWAKGFEIVLVAFVLLTVGLTARSAIRQRTLTPNAMLLIAFASMLWLDPMLNYLRPGFYFSQNLINVESWVQFIPGQLAPHANLIPVPYVWVIGAYIGFFLPVILLNVALARWMRRRWPAVRLSVVFAVIFLTSAAVDLGLEGVATRTGVMAYPSGSHTWSVWGGQTYQVPMIELVAAGMFWTLCSMLVLLRDDRGWTPIERGAETIASPLRQKIARQLALIGVANVLFLSLPLGVVQIGVAHTDPFPTGHPRHLTGEWCGDTGQPYGPCPAPGVSWKVRDAGHGVDPAPSDIHRSAP